MTDKQRPEERPCGESLGAFHAPHRYMIGELTYQCPGGAHHPGGLFVVAPESRPYEVRTVSGERYLAEADEVKHDAEWVNFRADGALTLSVRATDVRAVRQVDPEEIEHEADADDALTEARSWARHGYEIGQRHCGWSDHGVAPAWLTEGWPPHIDSCEHTALAAEYDTALARVRELPESPQTVDALTSDPAGYARGYRDAIREAKRAARAEQEGGPA